VKARGAFLHNIMPLISEPEHGTISASPASAARPHAELRRCRTPAPAAPRLMRHCRQCRADAVGLLGEDRGQEFTLDKIERPASPCVPARPSTRPVRIS
jgi:nitrogen fixation protein NifB